MRNFKFLFLIIIVFSLSACTDKSKIQKDIYGYSQKDITAAGKVCRDDIVQASKRDEYNRWSEWAKCEKKQKMNIDIQSYNLDLEDIEHVYDNRINRLLLLEKEYASLSPDKYQEELDRIYDLYDSEKAKTGANTCLNWRKTEGGGRFCTEYLKIWAAYNNGEWHQIPYFK